LYHLVEAIAALDESLSAVAEKSDC
jgi:hypothetical protein